MESKIDEELVLFGSKLTFPPIECINSIIDTLIGAEEVVLLDNIHILINSMESISQCLDNISKVTLNNLSNSSSGNNNQQISIQTITNFTGQTSFIFSNLSFKFREKLQQKKQQSQDNNDFTNNNNNNNLNNNSNTSNISNENDNNNKNEKINNSFNNNSLSNNSSISDYDSDYNEEDYNNSPCIYHTPFTTIGSPMLSSTGVDINNENTPTSSLPQSSSSSSSIKNKSISRQLAISESSLYLSASDTSSKNIVLSPLSSLNQHSIPHSYEQQQTNNNKRNHNLSIKDKLLVNNNNNNNNNNQNIQINECSTPFSPSSPPLSPSPMAALATSDRQTAQKMIPLPEKKSEEEIETFITCEKSQTEMVLNRIRNNVSDDALTRKNQKGYAMMSVILNDVNTNHQQSLINQSQPIQQLQTATINNYHSRQFYQQRSDDLSFNGSPLDTYLPTEDEDLANMYNVAKPQILLPPSLVPLPPPITQQQIIQHQQQQQLQQQQQTSHTQQPIKNNETSNNIQQNKQINNSNKTTTNTSTNNTTTTNNTSTTTTVAQNTTTLELAKVITFTKIDPNTTTFQFVKEKVPKLSCESEEDSDIYYDDYDDYDLDSESYDDETYSSTDHLSNASSSAYNSGNTSPIKNTSPERLQSPKLISTRIITNNNTTNNNNNITAIINNNNSNLTNILNNGTGGGSGGNGSGIQQHRRAHSLNIFGGGYPWFGGKLIQITVFLPTNPQSMVELSIDEDSTVEKVIIDLLELCQKEKKRLTSNSDSKSDPSTTTMPIDDLFSQQGCICGAESCNCNNSELFSFISIANAKAYNLRVCKDDGALDTDFGILDKSTEMKKIKSITFALVQNANSHLEPNEKVKVLRVYIVPSKPLSQKDETNISVRDSIAVPYHGWAKLSYIKSSICKKEKYKENLCVFMLMNGEVIKNESVTLDQLGVNEIKLIHNNTRSAMPKSVSFIADSGNAPRPITKLLGPMFFFTPNTAGEFKQFHVVKFNKFGLASDRLMGIDQDRITHSILGNNNNNIMMSGNINQKALKSSSIKRTFSSTKLKKPIQQMKDISSVGTNSNKPNYFYIKCKDGKVSEYFSQDAEEIVAKIQFIIKENKNKMKNKY